MPLQIEKHEILDLVTTVRSRNYIPDNDIDEMAIPTYLHNNKLIQWLFWERLNSVTEIGYKQQVDEVLDFGCGIGTLLPILHSKTRVCVHATDLYPHFAIELCRRKNLNVTFHESTMLQDSLKSDSLDLIVAADSMEHLEDPKYYLEIFRDKLKNEEGL
jgi:2-polyprenyl-3-methyl-5-hydroxy-6-metoxy-1,4-benzoquinol methylase